MKIKNALKTAVVVGLAIAPSIGFSVSWENKNVANLQSMYESSDCFYFSLEGVAQADPVLPGSYWFAISRTQNGAREAYAMLLSAKLTRQPVIVITNGALSCGHAGVSQVYMP